MLEVAYNKRAAARRAASETEAPLAAPAAPAAPRAARPLRLGRIFLALILLSVAVGAGLVWREMHSFAMQARFFSRLAQQLTYRLEPGPSPAIRFPGAGPYDERLGYSALPAFLSRLQAKDYAITAQARISPKMEEMAGRGYFATYREKTDAGLTIFDCRRQPLVAARFPGRLYAGFEDAPPILVNSLLYIENRELLDPGAPQRNPAVEWDRLSKAVLDKALAGIAGARRSPGGSTLATQMEKYRHSREGRTNSMQDKFRQMVSASLRAYQGGADSRAARRQIVLDYLNSVPLSAKPVYGEVNGIGDGMWVWYGRDFAELNRLLKDQLEQPAAALGYKQALSLLIAQRSPSHYLNGGARELEQLTNSHLRLLAAAGVISPALRDAALQLRLQASGKFDLPPAPADTFVKRKASNTVRTHLAGLLGDLRLYQLDRLDLSVASTLDAQTQGAVTEVLRNLRDPETAKAAGLIGKGLLGKGDPAQVVYSFTLLEKGENANYLRVQTDNFDQPLDINEGAKLDLGSTAKLRTLVTYLDIVAQLHQRYRELDRAALARLSFDPKDQLSRWAVGYFQQGGARDLPAMLEAAMERRYSASPAEAFMTGGGIHHFENFKKEDNGRILSVREGLRNSVNLVFVRLMRDVVHFYMFQTPGSSASLLADGGDPRRAAYLSRFADREGREFLQRFYAKYQGKNAWEAQQILLSGLLHATPSRLAAMHRTIAPDATPAEFAAFLNANLDSQNEVSSARAAELYEKYAPQNMSLSDRAYLATIHPLELWLVGFLRRYPDAGLTQIVAASAAERQQVYEWLFKTHRKHAQDKRIAGLLEVEGFLEIHRQWKRMGYPFASMTPSYASALGASADRPAALAELMGIIVSDGLRKPSQRIATLHFAAATPYETVLAHGRHTAGEPVLAPEVARVVAAALREVVAQGTARRARAAFTARDGSNIAVGGKTGTGDQRFDVFGAGGRLLESRYVNRSATFVFNIDQRFFGSMTAYVHGPQAKNYDFTSALPVQLLTLLAPSLMPLLEPAPDMRACTY
ncbi:MAG: penicillin-binding protein [Burkholderiales bacterium]|nr:penicillin-binding protein [Burkholderiales bacterium]